MELTYMMKTKMEILKALCIIDEKHNQCKRYLCKHICITREELLSVCLFLGGIIEPLIIYHASFCVENRSPVQIFTAGIFI